MNEENRTVDFLNKIYENAQTAGESISYLTKKVGNPVLLADLQCQHKAYSDLANQTVEALAQEKALPKSQNPFMQAGIWSGVQMNTMLDRTPDKIAEIMIEGSMMGVIDMTRLLKTYPDAPPAVQKLGQDLIALEENSIQKMKQYLG